MRRPALAALLALVSVAATAASPGPPPGNFFDDFSYADAGGLAAGGWTLRSAPGHPGVPGAAWQPGAVSLQADPARPGARWLTLTARTDGTPQGTVQAQLCHARKYLRGTYAARVRLAGAPLAGAGGDPVVMALYAVSPLRHDFDPEFSEIDWEYLPNGGWGSPRRRLYGITWQTVRLDPWQAHNQAHEQFDLAPGWHTLVTQVAEGRTHWFIDGRRVATHGGRNQPVVPMALSASLWFSPGGLLPPSAEPRVWQMDIDWVFHARDQVLSPQAVQAQVQRYRRAGTTREDTVPEAVPPLASGCDI